MIPLAYWAWVAVGAAVRGARLASKLGLRLDLGRLERLLREAQQLVARARESQR